MNKIWITTAAIALGLVVSAAMPTTASADRGERGERGDRPSFTELDADGNGELTLAELQSHGAKRFADADTDGDGLLSSDEMVAAAKAREEGRMAKFVDRMIERRDTNGDGFLSVEEMAPEGDRAERMLEHADADNNGTISEEEFASLKKPGHHGKRHHH